MQLRPLSIAILLVLFAISGVSTARGAAPKRIPKTLVEVWCGGDDGLTQRLKDSIDHQFKGSDDFEMSFGKKPKTLIVTIPSNVSWKQNGKRTEVFYNVAFTSIKGEILGGSRGSCFDDDLAKCSVHIFSDAQVAASKVQ